MARQTRLLTTWLMCFISSSMTSAEPVPLKLRWNTDTYGCSKGENCDPLGPDGPWQAVAMTVVNDTTSSKNTAGRNSGWTAFYPSPDIAMDTLADTAGGPYHHPANKSSVPSLYLHDDDGSSKNMTRYVDSFRLATPVAQFSVSVAVNDITAWQVALPNGTIYTPQTGRFGLAPHSAEDSLGSSPPGPLDQLKSSGQITSRFFGLHMGSAALHQAASLTLGGYEQNRVVGPIGSFRNDVFTTRTQGRIFLIDVDYDTGMTYLAQAPGPSAQDQSVFQTVEAGNTSIQSSPIEVFAQSWRPRWTTTIPPNQRPSADAQKSDRLSGGAIAGVVVGSLAGLVLMVGLAVSLWRKRRRARGNETLAAAAGGETKNEKDSVGITPEVAGREIAHEMVVPAARHEVSEGDVPAELPGH